jgi:hypothetical protein
MGGPLRPSLLPRLAGQSSPKIIAYHGSPHSFSRFDASKIGTGEGQQAYGHGLYFAGNEKVADGYREALSAGGLVRHTPEEKAEFLWRYMANSGATDPRQAVLKTLANDQATLGVDNRAAIEYLMSLPSDFVPPPPSPPPRLGHMYEVEIDAPEGQLLDLDLPVQSQSQVVQDALGKYVEAPRWFSLGQEGWAGENAYMRMAGDMANANPRIVGGYHVTHDQPAASAALLQRGVPGIRYLDQGSRSAGEGTHNYVMFPGTEDRIRILRKYGLLAPMALPAMSEE